jgi:hypothetical protein|tara:strand:- start:5380 stop:6645 length:1266 start_codon:yes stop_codon:yes gene_type:complete
MAINYTVSDFEVNSFVGQVTPAGVANLTITPIGDEEIFAEEFFIGGAAAAANVNGAFFVGGNVSPEVTQVAFTDNGDGTVNVAISYNAFVVQANSAVHIDIDRKALSPVPPPQERKGCTNPEAINYDPLATSDDGSCQFVIRHDNPNPVGHGDAVVTSFKVDTPNLKTPNAQFVTVSNTKEASYKVVLYNKTTGEYYNFNDDNELYGGFTKNRRNVDHIETLAPAGAKKLLVQYPGISANAVYKIYVEPIGDTKLAKDVPSKSNPFEFTQRIDTTISLNLKTANTSNWTIGSAATISDRPGKKPLRVTKKTFPEVDMKFVDGKPGYKQFSLTAAFGAGGGKSSAALVTNRKPQLIDLSAPTDLTVLEKTDSGAIANRIRIEGADVSYATDTLTITGLLVVEKFGTTSETITIDIDNIVTLS